VSMMRWQGCNFVNDAGRLISLVYILAYISTMSMERTQHLNRLLQFHKADTVLLAP
jgi:hypothetical protein